MSGAMSNLALRFLTALIALPLVGLLVLWDERLGFGLLIFLFTALGMLEYTAMTLPAIPRLQRAALVAIGVGLTVALYGRPDLALVWVAGAVIVTATVILLHPGEIASATGRLGAAVFGVLYLGAFAAPLALLQRDVTDGPLWVFVAIGVSFANDTGAYFAGRGLGRHKLYPLISPGKTVEGAVGGLLGGFAATLIVRAIFFHAMTLRDCLLVAVPAGVLGPIGDLVESMLKRSAGVKDSGRTIPGHGGVLDRVDALLFVVFWVYVYASWLR